jgi:hypothetical protein
MVYAWCFVHHLDASIGYLLPSLETFHSTATDKIIRLFMDVIHEVAWYVIKKNEATKQLYYPALTNIHGVTNNKNIHPILGTLCAIIR